MPAGEALELLAADYAKMTEDGVLLDDEEPFAGIIERCRTLQQRTNALAPMMSPGRRAAPNARAFFVLADREPRTPLTLMFAASRSLFPTYHQMS